MSVEKDEGQIQRREYTLEEALDIVGCGHYTNFLAFMGGLLTMSAMCMTQGMYYVLPAVGCEFQLDDAEKGFIASTVFIGSMLSATWWGFLVDCYGRRRVLLVTTFGAFLSILVGSLAPTASTLMVACFITGFMLGGVFGNPYVYVSEFVPARIRSNKLIIIAVVASFSNIFSPCIAWAVMEWDLHLHVAGYFYFSSWRLFLMLNGLPMIISFVILHFLPESPKYLLSKARPEEAIDSLSRVFAANYKRTKDDFPVFQLRVEMDDVSGPAQNKQSNGFVRFVLTLVLQIKELFTPPLLTFTVICSSMKFACIGLYSVIYLWVPDQSNRLLKYWKYHEDYDATLCEVMSEKGGGTSGKCFIDTEIYLVIISVGALYSVVCIAMTFLVRVVQLKMILGMNILLAATTCLVMLFFRSMPLTLLSLGFVVAILAASQPAVFGIIVHLFPTPLRATATSVCVVFGRLAVPIASYILGTSFRVYCNQAYYTLAAILAGIGIVCFLTPFKKKPSG